MKFYYVQLIHWLLTALLMNFPIRWPFAVLFVVAIPPVLYLGVGDIQLQNDKIVHFTTFALMSILFHMAVALDRKWRLHWLGCCVVVCCGIGAVGSEFFQHWVNPKRAFDVYDIGSNLLGSALGLGIAEVFSYKSSNYTAVPSESATDSVEMDEFSV